MEEIFIGAYIRFNNGGIHKVKEIKTDCLIVDSQRLVIRFSWLEKICTGYKVGKTKLELIEVGDIVNGKRVDNKSGNMIALEYCERCNLWGEVIDDDSKIKTVLTKEQYMNNCLKEDSYDM